MPSVGPELAPTKLTWFSFLPRVPGLVAPLAAVGWSSSSLRGARWGLMVVGTPVLLELLGGAGVPRASPGSHGVRRKREARGPIHPWTPGSPAAYFEGLSSLITPFLSQQTVSVMPVRPPLMLGTSRTHGPPSRSHL